MTVRAVPLVLALALAARPAAAQAPPEPPATPVTPARAAGPTPAPGSARETGAPPLPEGATLEVPVGAAVYRSKTTPPRRADPREERFARPGEEIDASEALDEMIDEVAADVARLGAGRVSPILLERLRLSPNLDPGLAAILEARLAAALHRATDAVLVKCVECDATRAQVVDSAWVVSRGITRREQAQDLARRYGARTFLTVSLSARVLPASLALDVELVRGDDGAIAYAESYRYGGDNAMLYRGADRAQAREQRLKDLEDRLNEKPSWGYAALVGYVIIPSTGTKVEGPYGALRLDERFGDDRQHRISITAGGFDGGRSGVSGGLLQFGVSTRLSPPNVWSQTFHVGAVAGWYLGGGVGNTPFFGATAEYRIATRLGLHATLGYLSKFKYMGRPDPEIGGVVPELGVSFIW
jgi:hypothetical protein